MSSNDFKANVSSVLAVLELAERLKIELRHSYMSNGRQESVAEHTWRMALMAVLIEPMLPQQVDMSRLLKMIVIHDLVEAEAGDVSVLEILRKPALAALKVEREAQAALRLREMLAGTNGDDIYSLFQEFEKKSTYEAQVANALDKLEVQLQHNHADLSTWEAMEHELAFRVGRYTVFDPTLDEFRRQIETSSEQKLREGGVDVDTIRKRLKQ